MKIFVFILTLGLVIAGSSFSALAEETEHQSHPKWGINQPALKSELGQQPKPVVLLEPKALATISGTSATLKWKANGAPNYHVQVATDPRFKWLVTENFDVTGDSFEVKDLKAGQQYFWRVAAHEPGHDNGHTRGFFSASSFETK